MTDGWPFGDLQPGCYGVILADPPWLFANYSPKGERKNPNQHYQCMPVRDIALLPVAQLAAKDCALVMWATSPMLNRQIAVLEGWGFTYKAAGGWAKQTKNGKRAFGPGYIQRSAMEFWLIGTIGKPRVLSHSVRNFMDEKVREHSRKPDQMRADCEALWDGPYCELFARQSAPGWDTWGDERSLFDDQQETRLAA
jgi:N6-adenosine-specific RNA methylase IME4